MDINYEYYKIFYYVAKYKNITKAAAAMKSSQPNVTRVIRLLEQGMGCQLLLRTNKGIELTEDGQKLFLHVKAACEQLQEAEEEIGAAVREGRGTIVVGTTETALHICMFSLLNKFHKKFPQIRLKIHNYNTPQALKALQSGTIELAVVPSPFRLPKSFCCIYLEQFCDILIAGEEYRELSEKEKTLSELTEYPWVSLAKNTATYDLYNSRFLQEGLVLEPDVEVATADLILPMIQNNLGIGFLPKRFAEAALKKGEVFEVRLDTPMQTRQVCMIYDKKRGLQSGADILKQYIVEKQKCGSF